MSTQFARSVADVRNPGLVGLVSLAHGFNEFFSIVVPPLFPFLVPSLPVGYSRASLLVVAFFLTYSVVQLPVGPVADVYSNRNILVAGMAVLAAGIAVVAAAPTFEWMLAGMVVAGVGGSTYHPTGMALISDVEPPDTHGRSMGIHGALGSAGTVVAPLVVVGVAELVGWRAALLAGAALGFAFAGALYIAYPRVSPDERERQSRGIREAVGRAFGEGAGLRERARQTARYVATPRLLALSALFLVVGAEVRAVQTFTASFAVASAGLGAAFGGAMLSLTMATAAGASVLAGSVVDRTDRALFAAATFVGTALVVVALVTTDPGPLVLAAGFAVLGAVLYAVYPAANAIAATATEGEDGGSGSLFAVTNTASAVGGAAGPYLLGVVADAASVEYAFLATAGIAGVGVVVAGFAAVAVR